MAAEVPEVVPPITSTSTVRRIVLACAGRTCPIARDNTAESKNPIRVMLVSFLLNITAPFEAGKSFIRHRERAAYLHCSRICHIW